MSTTERIHFRLINTECCNTLLCWVNPRLPNYCPECGKHIYPTVKGWITTEDLNGILKLNIKEVNYANIN